MPMSKNFVYARNNADAWKRARRKYPNSVVVGIGKSRDVHGRPIKYTGAARGRVRYDVRLGKRKSTVAAERRKRYNEHPITKRMNILYKRRKADIVRTASSKSRVALGLKSEPKGVLISMILESEYGNRRMDAWRALRFGGGS